MSCSITNFIQDESGQGIIEYAACLALVAGLLLSFSRASTGTLGSAIISVFRGLVGLIAQLEMG